jgi:hypothetical protein
VPPGPAVDLADKTEVAAEVDADLVRARRGHPGLRPSTAYTDTMPGHRIFELPVYRKFGPSFPRYRRDKLPEEGGTARLTGETDP